MLIIILAEQVISGKIKLEQIGTGFGMRAKVEAKVKELTQALEEKEA